MTNTYDGDRLRGKKLEGTDATYYLRSSVLGQQVIGEIGSNGALKRGYVYAGNQLVALQGPTAGEVSYVHQDPITKSQRITNTSGAIVSTVDLDPFGGETSRSLTSAFQPRKYTSYEGDGNGDDDAMMRRYQSALSRFAQPDPYDGSYSLSNPQSFNRYAYVGNDPVNFVDPTGLERQCVIIRHEDGRLEEICFETQDAVQIYMTWDDLPGAVGLGMNIQAPLTMPVLPGSSRPRASTPTSFAPTLANVKREEDARRARSLNDCLSQANNDYEKLKRQNGDDYVNSMIGIQSSATHGIAALALRSLGGSLIGFAINWGVSTAYYAPGAVANKQAHQRARTSCYSFYGPR